MAAEQVNTYLTWDEPPAEVAKKVADVRARAARHGRTVSFGIRLYVIVRETDDEAWQAAENLISRLDPGRQPALAGCQLPQQHQPNRHQTRQRTLANSLQCTHRIDTPCKPQRSAAEATGFTAGKEIKAFAEGA